MRTFTIISILLALAVTAILWQKLLVNSTPDRFIDPADYSTMQEDQPEDENITDACSDADADTPGCEPEMNTAEQDEMGQQRGQAHDVMMKSFDKKYDKYQDQINGR